ncbi:type IV pilus twitching motility protein PilT [Actinotalea solisilvae]|uniref:type IV pilus twitching motility protein PilT n=1 Tax=Actinotalea solisilvae TaxID=2072922 RepID=UPI0027DC455A|nr:PilT/PilU family type 4a pilus ATPase [Actinotalea solisilvae]
MNEFHHEQPPQQRPRPAVPTGGPAPSGLPYGATRRDVHGTPPAPQAAAHQAPPAGYGPAGAPGARPVAGPAAGPAYPQPQTAPYGQVPPPAGYSQTGYPQTGYPPAPDAASRPLGAPSPAQPAAAASAYTSAPPAPSAPAQAPAPSPAPRASVAAERSGRLGMTQGPGSDDLDLEAALRTMIAMGASDLHVTSGAQPTVRMDGHLQPLDGFAPLDGETIQRSIYAVLTQRQRETFEQNLELDFAYAVRGVARFRVNLYQQRDSVGAAFRVIPYEIKPLEALGVPPVVANFANLPRGLVLVTGPTGSGKSTTLASIIDLANRTRSDHIMTVEDPIEFLHRHKKSLINQREVGADTHSFANALKHVLRQDPDIILVGEMRDLETISVALTAAETGHLVFATLHTQDAAQTIDRIIDVFPPSQQAQVRTQLAGAIQGVVCQTLSKRADGPGRAVATEVMIATPAIRNLIREGKTHQIYSAMQAGAQMGMHTMDQHLADLVKTGKITYEQGLEKCHHTADYNRLTGRTAGGSGGGTAFGAMSGGMGDPLGNQALGTAPSYAGGGH